MGRHSAPDDDGENGDDATTATGPVAVAPPAGRPRPGRHSQPSIDDDADGGLGDVAEPRGGLDIFDHVLIDEDEDEDSTAKIKPIVDPILDEPVPAAATTVIPAVRDHDRSPDDVGPAAAQERQDAGPADAAEPTESAKPKGKAKRPEPRVSDRAVLRDDPAARARVIAAVVAPFVIYVVVLIVLGSLDLRTFLIWIWAPLITAGIVAGLILDLAHRAAAARAITAAEERANARG